MRDLGDTREPVCMSQPLGMRAADRARHVLSPLRAPYTTLNAFRDSRHYTCLHNSAIYFPCIAFIIIIILWSGCVPWLGEGLSMPSPKDPVLCCPLSYLVAPVYVQVVSPPLGWSPCHRILSYGLQVVTREVHRSYLRRLICSAQDHFIFLTVLTISMTCVLSLTHMLVFLSLHCYCQVVNNAVQHWTPCVRCRIVLFT